MPAIIHLYIVKDDIAHRVGIVTQNHTWAKRRVIDFYVAESKVLPGHVWLHWTWGEGDPRPEERAVADIFNLLSRSDPYGKLFGFVHNDVFVQNVGYHASAFRLNRSGL